MGLKKISNEFNMQSNVLINNSYHMHITCIFQSMHLNLKANSFDTLLLHTVIFLTDATQCELEKAFSFFNKSPFDTGFLKQNERSEY